MNVKDAMDLEALACSVRKVWMESIDTPSHIQASLEATALQLQATAGAIREHLDRPTLEDLEEQAQAIRWSTLTDRQRDEAIRMRSS